MAPIRQSRVRNRLLRALAPDDFALLEPHLEQKTTSLRECLIAPYEQIKQLYFPETGFVSVTTRDSRDRVEVGIIGREGLAGASPVLLGADRSPYLHLVQSAGEVLAIDAEALGTAVERSRSLQRMLLRSVQVQITQTAQTAYVNATYTTEARLARWLLMCRDRLGDEEMQLTHEFLAMMLGVRRSGATVAVQVLEGNGLIRARRGHITVLDRRGLEETAEDGYGLPEAEFARLIEGA